MVGFEEVGADGRTASERKAHRVPKTFNKFVSEYFHKTPLRALPLLLYVVLAIAINSVALFGADYYSGTATTAAWLIMFAHTSEFFSEMAVMKRDAKDGGPPLFMQFALCFVFGFFHWYPIKAAQAAADKQAKGKQAGKGHVG
eukprot:SAG31_NODE_2034_length_6611_cov_5.685964_5_plen_143_part_00